MMGGVGGFYSGFGIYDKWPFYPCLIQVYRLNINLSNLILNFALYRKNQWKFDVINGVLALHLCREG